MLTGRQKITFKKEKLELLCFKELEVLSEGLGSSPCTYNTYQEKLFSLGNLVFYNFNV
jgi:hypothetical protein